MLRKISPVVAAVLLLWATASSIFSSLRPASRILRLTHSGNNVASFPCLSEDGRRMAYVLEIKDGEKSLKSIRVMDLSSSEDKELFRDNTRQGLPPFGKAKLRVGTKPPVLSGDGSVAAFALSVGEPEPVSDHYLALAQVDGSALDIFAFPVASLLERDLKRLDLKTGDWERVSTYALSDDGLRLACVVKGHLGPLRYGQPSGIIIVDLRTREQRTLLAPDFMEDVWQWTTYPSRPLTGGGWAFGLSGNGEKIVFGAQSSEDPLDYDLYIAEWDSDRIQRITDFHDRWFSQADISEDASRVVFFYSGQKKNGIGTYLVDVGGDLKFLDSPLTPQLEFLDLSGSGRHLLFKHIYRGMMRDLVTDQETVVFDENTPGYASGITPMDYPPFPSFWTPRIIDGAAKTVLLVGPPTGRESPEIYLLRLGEK